MGEDLQVSEGLQVSEDLQNNAALPVRTTRHRRTGRHSSPHQLSLPTDAPALVLAVPGPASDDGQEVTSRLAELVSEFCPGVGIYVGYLHGEEDSLQDTVTGLARAESSHPAVLVPLQAFPDPEADAAISACAASAPMRCLAAAPLGPHPLLGEALHARLAEAGLAHATRVGRVNVVTGTGGVIVGAVGGPDAVKSAEVVAVLLASRLMVPVACEPLDNPARIVKAAGNLHAAGVNRVVLAPCVVGPEVPPDALANLAASTGLDCAAPLGPHPAIAKLVANRYGTALVDPLLADTAAKPAGTRRRAGSHSS